jgi:hypothetical protein
MIKRFLFILILILLVSTVSAETLTGTLGGSGGYTTNTGSYQSGGGGGTDNTNATYMVLYNTEYLTGLASYVRWDLDTGANSMAHFKVANTAPGEATNFVGYIGATQVVTGTIGYQRYWNYLGVEQIGYQYVVFNTWNLTGFTGTQYLNMSYDHAAIHYMYYDGFGPWQNPSPPTGYCQFRLGTSIPNGNYDVRGNHQILKSDNFQNTYTVTRPAGIGTSGTVTKGGYFSKVYIYNATSGAAVASEFTVTGTDYNFTTNANPIIIGAVSSLGTAYNSSILFAPTIPTVTPTPTQTPGGGPGTESNITIAVKGISNDSAIVNAYVEMQFYKKAANHNDPNAWFSSLQGYTAATTGYFQADMVDISTYDIKVIVQKAGYQTSTEWITPSPYYYSRIIWLYLDTTGQGGIPATINMTLQVKNSVTGANIANALVTAQDTIAGTSSRSALTNATGYAVFKTFPNTANIQGTITATNYQTRSWSLEIDPETGTYLQSKDYSKVLYMAPIGVPTGTVTPYPTPTPTPIAQDLLSLSATPDSVSIGDNVVLVGSSSNATRLTYAGGLRQTLFYMNRNNPNQPYNDELIGVFYNVNATYWKFRANNNDAFGTPTTASPLTLTHVPQTNALYTYKFAAFDVNTKAIGAAATKNVLVGGGAGAGSLVMNLQAQDGRTTSHLMNYQLNITDDASGVVTEYGNITYDKDVSLLRGNSYTLRASKSLYQSGSQQFTVPVNPAIIAGSYGAIAVVKLYPDGWITVGNCSVSVHVNDAETYYPISNVAIAITGYATQYTGAEAESASFSIPANTAYTVTASKPGYCSVSESRNTSTDTYQYVSMMMKYGACTGTTPTPTPTSSIIPTTVPTPIGGVYNGTAAVCGNLPESPTMMDVLRNSFACNGIVDLVMQNMALSVLIMLICAIVLGRVASGIGVLAGAIIGATVSTAMGILPFWIIIVLIILAGLIFAGKIFWSNQ